MCLFKAIIINVHFWRIKAVVAKIKKQSPYNESSIMWNELFVVWNFYVFNILSNNYGIIKNGKTHNFRFMLIKHILWSSGNACASKLSTGSFYFHYT